MIQVTKVTIPAGNEILKAATERGKIRSAARTMHQAITYYTLWKDTQDQPECLAYAKKLLIRECDEFGKLTYNNPYANTFGQDIKLAFYYHNLLATEKDDSGPER